MIIAPGLAPKIPAYTVKLHPRCQGDDPADHGVLLLHELETGALLAVMGSTHLTAVRTGLTSAIAADLLANADARAAGLPLERSTRRWNGWRLAVSSHRGWESRRPFEGAAAGASTA